MGRSSGGKATFEAEYVVYWHLTDAAGIAHFSRELLLVEQAEEDLYRSFGVAKGILASGPRREVYARFNHPLKLGDRVRVRLWLEEMRGRAVKYGFEIYDVTAQRVAAEGYVVAVCVAVEGGELKAAECPEELARAWREAGGPPQPNK